MIVAKDAKVDKGSRIEELTSELTAFVRTAANEGVVMHEVERDVLTRLLQIGHAVLEEFLRMQGSGDLGETFTLDDGRVLKRLSQLHSRKIQTVFGALELQRTVYGTREGQAIECVPLDSRLALPESKFSYVVQDLSQLLTCEEPFAKVAAFLERLLGVTLHVDSLERTNRAMASEVESFRDSQPIPPPAEEGEILVESADGKGVPIRRPADAPRIQDHQHKRGPKKDRKKMAIVGTGYTVDISKLQFLSPLILRKVRMLDGYPDLKAGFESSLPGLHFVGATAARTYGPLLYFVTGTEFASRELRTQILRRRGSSR